MGQEHHTTATKKYKHLKEEERHQIEGFLKAKMKPREIALLIGKSERTIQRERKRGTATQMNGDLTFRREYLADFAERRRREAKKRGGAKRKLPRFPELMRHIEREILEKRHSPDAVIGRMKLEGTNFGRVVCAKTVYNATDAGLFDKLTNKHLWEKRRRRKRPQSKARVALRNLRGTSIDKRPAEANERSEYGHWEIDPIVSGANKGKAALLVMTERKSREEIIAKIRNKTQDEVKRVFDETEKALGHKAFKAKFKTITADNGSEFLDFAGLEKAVRGKRKRTKMYYAHPYGSWERGSNENMNRMIGRFIPKGADIRRIPLAEIARIRAWPDDMPRRSLGFLTPAEAAAL